MNPLSPSDFNLECDLARWEAADDERTERDWDDGAHWSDEQDAALCEREAVELAAGARMRPFSEVV